MKSQPAQPSPLELPNAADWSRRPPAAWKLALLAVHALPKGRGVAANWIGRNLLKGKQFVSKTPTGSHLAVEPSNLAYFALLSTGKAKGQIETVRRCLSLLNADSVFYDIGANAGYISVEAARVANQVVAFEPQPALARACAASVALNGLGNVRVYQAAVGRESGTLELFVPRFGIHASAVARESNARPVTCPLVTIDELVDSKSIPPPTCMKIDVEGAELDVFKGAAQTIRRHRPALLFEADENLARFGLSKQDVLNFLSSVAPYRFFAMLNREKIPADDARAAYAADILAII